MKHDRRAGGPGTLLSQRKAESRIVFQSGLWVDHEEEVPRGHRHQEHPRGHGTHTPIAS